MRNLYICERPYPLYRTMVKAVREVGEHDILLGNHVPGMEKMLQPLRESGIFKNVYFFDDIEYRNFYKYGTTDEFLKFPKGIFMLYKKFSLYWKLQKDAKKLRLPDGLDIVAYDDIYVNDATSSINLYLFSKRRNVVWVEHARDVFQNDVVNPLFYFVFWLTKQFEKVGLCYGLHGTSKYVKALEVSNDKDLIPLIKHKEIREVNLDDILNGLSGEEKDKVFEVYSKAYGIEISGKEKVSVLLTQPLCIDGLVPDMEKQIQIYRKIIEEYMCGADIILIKPHPRDTVDYKDFIPCSIVVEPAVSAEILNLGSRLYFDKAVTVNSSSIHSFAKAKEKIMLGEEYIRRYLP